MQAAQPILPSTTRSPTRSTASSNSIAAVPTRCAARSSRRRRAARRLSQTLSSCERTAMSEFFPTLVYVLCFLTSTACAWLLGRSYYRNGTRLLLWSSICFVFLAANNLALVLDLVVFPSLDLRLARLLLALAAVVSLIWGFVWEVREE